MHPGRTELFVVLLIAAAGVALATVVALAPWHPTTAGWNHDDSQVTRLDSPNPRNHERLPRN